MQEPISITILFCHQHNLPVAAKESDSVNSFKRFLNQTKTPVPKYYTGSRKAQILHTWLRTNCSSLNMDLFLKISVILLYAGVKISKMLNTFFQEQRNELLNAVLQFQTPSLSLLLFGDISVSLEINKTIFENVHMFIMKTKRF